MPLADDLIRARDAASRLNVSVATFHRWVERGRIAPTYRFPGERGAMLFTPSDVESLREQLKAEALARFDEAAS